ncbi:hypothetical protein C499_17994 [Halogeometricum borinquense DSM 11551]|uniref:Uncharacterized protein n=1 Tax=Halogeometricum borinquense (strain ATCC 700274 / DSM 11551 / JCM 10706 / KCTC 4070 / PR3) TaxID=469382 RepID=E4NPI1_HALBP|nr:hypothetical protein [Halogeometricum borinquense]ADQ67651.1 hypothetical protein Hbor_20860 [Halogeometricum borinquense DSM 11551]ELY23668.1 hypothetical protein C499_17994 [Halogeometricum borinquense DSM 11551]
MRASKRNRGVSTTLGYVLTLSITAVLVSGLLIGTGQYVDDQRRQVADRELSVLSERIAARTADIDRMVRAGDGTNEVRVRIDLPRTVAGESYRIEVSEPTVTTPRTHDIMLTTGQTDQAVTVSLRTGLDIEAASLSGGNLVVVYNPADGRLSFESGDTVSPAVLAPSLTPSQRPSLTRSLTPSLPGRSSAPGGGV